MSKREGGTLVPQTIQNLSMILRKIRVSKYFLYWDLEPRWPLSFCSSPWTGNRNLSYILTLSNIFLVYLKYPQRTWFLRSGTSSLKPDVFFVTLDHSSFRQSESCNIILYICMLFCKCPLVDRTGITVQSLSHVQLFATPWTAAGQASLSITNSQSLRKLMSIESVMPSSHLILCCPLLLPPSIFPNIRVFSNESVLRIRWPKYWSFSFSISPSNECSGLISFRKLGLTGWISLQSKGLSRVFSNTTVQKHQFFSTQLSL